MLPDVQFKEYLGIPTKQRTWNVLSDTVMLSEIEQFRVPRHDSHVSDFIFVINGRHTETDRYAKHNHVW